MLFCFSLQFFLYITCKKTSRGLKVQNFTIGYPIVHWRSLSRYGVEDGVQISATPPRSSVLRGGIMRQSALSSWYGVQAHLESAPSSWYGVQAHLESAPSSWYGVQAHLESAPSRWYGVQAHLEGAPSSWYGVSCVGLSQDLAWRVAVPVLNVYCLGSAHPHSGLTKTQPMTSGVSL